jgi:methionine biosynthesis protein MetW
MGPDFPSINLEDWIDSKNLPMEHLSIDCWAAVIGGSLETMQAMHYPLLILEEMLRAGKECSITFPIFGYWRIRFDLAVNGRMRVTKELSYQRYDTPNRHFFTSDDVERFCEQKSIKIISRQFFSCGCADIFAKDLWPNMFAATTLLMLSR